MKKLIIAAVLFLICGSALSGQVGLPLERLALPEVQGSYLVCIWDEAGGQWLGGFETYDHSGVYEFQVPEWGRWYWVGLWDEGGRQYVFGKWIGHFPKE